MHTSVDISSTYARWIISPYMNINKHLVRQCPTPSAGFCLRKQKITGAGWYTNQLWHSPRWRHSSNIQAIGVIVGIMIVNQSTSQMPPLGGRSLECVECYANGLSDSLRGVHSCSMKAIQWVVVEIMSINHSTNQRPAYGWTSVDHDKMLISC